ncbi:slowpoke-binding protein-like [Diadema antillarum]|uniref:slowpoke-binding protein-like n=1 Tax=Diadema antillarum TaxID=105358 RepID=UPI003A8B98A1
MEMQTWLIALIVVLSVLVALGLAFLLFKLYRRCTRYDYTPLKEDMALPEKLSQARQIQRNEVRENALLNFQYFIRSRNGKYAFSQHLPDMGSRMDKHWFMVRPQGRWTDQVVTQCSRSPTCPVPFTFSNQKTIRDLLLGLKHPYIWPILDIDLWEEHEMVIVVQDFNSSGSLKDYIYNVKPRHNWSEKYGMQSRGLALKQIKLFGLQILKAVIYLQDNGFPPHSHIQSGNVIVHKGACRLSGLENVFLGYTSRIYPSIKRLLKDQAEAIDTISFGHVLFEMGAGRELEEAFPARAQLNRCKYPELIQLLEFIFDVAGDYPTITNVADHQFFAEVRLKELQKQEPKYVHLTTAMKSLIKATKRGKALKSYSQTHFYLLFHQRNKSKSSSKKASLADVPNGTASSHPAMPSPAAAPVPPPPPSLAAAPPPRPAPAVGFAPSGSSSNTTRDIPRVEGRGALLSDIQKGITLRKASTNDRSNPRV